MEAFDALDSDKFDPTKFICDYIASEQAREPKDIALISHLDRLECDVTNARKKMDENERIDRTKNAKEEAEVMVHASHITEGMQDSYCEFLRLEAEMQPIKVDMYSFELQESCSSAAPEINLKYLQEIFTSSLNEKKYLEAASLLCVVYNILQQPFAVKFASLLNFFSDSREELKQTIINGLSFEFDAIYEPLNVNFATGAVLTDEHVQLFNHIVNVSDLTGPTLTLLEVQIYIAYELDFVDDILNRLTLHPESPDFYVNVLSVENYVECLFNEFRIILRRIYKISQVAQKFELQTSEKEKIEIILRNFSVVRTEISLVINKFIEQCKTEELKLCDFEVFDVCIDLLYKNEEFLRQEGYYIGCDDQELISLLNGLEHLLVDFAISGQEMQTPHAFKARFVLENRFHLLDTAFARSESLRVTEFQHGLIENIRNLGHVFQSLQDFNIEIVNRFLRRVMTIKYVYFQECAIERIVDLLYYYATLLKFVTPECFGILAAHMSGYELNELEVEQRHCHNTNSEHFDLLLAELVLEVNKGGGEKASKLKRFREYCGDRKYDLYAQEMEAFITEYLI